MYRAFHPSSLFVKSILSERATELLDELIIDETRPGAYVSMIFVIKYIKIGIFSRLAYFNVDFSFKLHDSHVQ